MTINLEPFIKMVLSFSLFQWVLAPILGIPVTYTNNLIITVVIAASNAELDVVIRRIFTGYWHDHSKCSFNAATVASLMEEPAGKRYRSIEELMAEMDEDQNITEADYKREE